MIEEEVPVGFFCRYKKPPFLLPFSSWTPHPAISPQRHPLNFTPSGLLSTLIGKSMILSLLFWRKSSTFIRFFVFLQVTPIPTELTPECSQKFFRDQPMTDLSTGRILFCSMRSLHRIQRLGEKNFVKFFGLGQIKLKRIRKKVFLG